MADELRAPAASSRLRVPRQGCPHPPSRKHRWAGAPTGNLHTTRRQFQDALHNSLHKAVVTLTTESPADRDLPVMNARLVPPPPPAGARSWTRAGKRLTRTAVASETAQYGRYLPPPTTEGGGICIALCAGPGSIPADRPAPPCRPACSTTKQPRPSALPRPRRIQTATSCSVMKPGAYVPKHASGC